MFGLIFETIFWFIMFSLDVFLLVGNAMGKFEMSVVEIIITVIFVAYFAGVISGKIKEIKQRLKK